jgi:DNA-binding beta-propeller fold protein YncE
MLQKALALVLVVASIAGCVSCYGTSSHFVYAAIPAANQLAAFREDPYSGVLTQLSGSPYSVGDGVRALALHPSGKFLYAANPGQNEDDISLFMIQSDGTLSEAPRTLAGTSPTLLAMDPAGAYLYVGNALSNNISVFSIASGTGVLSQITGSPFQINLPPTNMQISPSGNFLYVSAPSSPTGVIAIFSVSAGALTFAGTVPTADNNPTGLAIDPSGSYLYTTNTSANSISIFSIGSNGALTAVAGSPLADNSQHPVAVLVDPAGQYLYVANQGSNNIGSYSITAGTGFPAAITDAPFGSEAEPSTLAIDSSSKYLFVGNLTSGGVQAFGSSGGSLNSIATYPLGNGITSIVVVQ